jgi:hypothetical protein
MTYGRLPYNEAAGTTAEEMNQLANSFPFKPFQTKNWHWHFSTLPECTTRIASVVGLQCSAPPVTMRA